MFSRHRRYSPNQIRRHLLFLPLSILDRFVGRLFKLVVWRAVNPRGSFDVYCIFLPCFRAVLNAASVCFAKNIICEPLLLPYTAL